MNRTVTRRTDAERRTTDTKTEERDGKTRSRDKKQVQSNESSPHKKTLGFGTDTNT